MQIPPYLQVLNSHKVLKISTALSKKPLNLENCGMVYLEAGKSSHRNLSIERWFV